MSLRNHQVRAAADFYVRARQRAQDVQAVYLAPPVLSDQQAVLVWDHERRKAEAAMGTVWQMPCRAGKTRTALTVLYHWGTWLSEWGIAPAIQQMWAHPHLVLVPSDLVRDGPWVQDWEEVAPPWETRVSIRPIPTMSQERMITALHSLRPGDVAVMTYHTLLARQDLVAAVPWCIIVADEVHRLKNPRADWTQASYKLQSVFRLGMSATPFTNYVHELREVLAWAQGWTVGDRRNSHIWPDSYHWKENWCNWDYVPTRNGYTYRRIPAGAAYPGHLYNLLRAEVLFSAPREEVSDAPDPIIHALPVPLSAKQAEVYERLKAGVLRWVKQGKIDAIDTGPVIAQFGYLFQLCADARQLELSIANKRGNALSYTNIPSTFTENWALADKSSKLKALLWVLDKVAKNGEQVLVLTGYARTANILTQDLIRLGYNVEAITGDTDDRPGVVSRFASGTTRVVVCTRAAWEGISLRAPYAVLYGFVDHTPGLVKQALMRAWSMFDCEPVEVFDIYAPGTVEEWNRLRLAAKDRFSGVMTNGKEGATFSSVGDISAALEGKLTRVNLKGDNGGTNL